VHVSPMVPVLKTYQSLGGPDMISSKRGSPTPRATIAPQSRITNTLIHLSHIPATRNSRKGCLGRTPLARLALTTRRRILFDQLNPYHTPKTHANIPPVHYLVFTKFTAPHVLRTYVSPSPASHHRYNVRKGKAVSM
jgi:hypothetical protein